MTASPKNIKITLVGAGTVGKTCLIISYTRNVFPTEWEIPTVFENCAEHITVDLQTYYDVHLWDTAGQEDYKTLRLLSYRHTTCFLVCYSVSRPLWYKNEVTKFVSEVRHHMPHTPIILVATKVDLRDDPKINTVSEKDGKKLKRRIKADAYIECSAKNGVNLSEVFEEAVRCSLKENTSTRTCTIF